MTRSDLATGSASVHPAPADTSPQARYQVRFDEGASGLARIAAGADIVVWVDPLGAAPEMPALGADGAGAVAILRAGFVDRAAVARWILDEQERLGRRAYLAIVAAKSGEGFAALDVLAAGAVIDALVGLGIDDTSPEAAVVCGAFTSLRRAVRHLATASVAGREALAAGATHEQVLAAAALDATDQVRVVRPGASG